MTQRMKRSVIALVAVAVPIVFVANRARTRHTTEPEQLPAARVTPTEPRDSGERPLDQDFKAAMERESAATQH